MRPPGPLRAQVDSSPQTASSDAAGKTYRFVPEDDPTFEAPPGGLDTFVGTRQEGAEKGSFRVYYALPGNPDAPRAIDLLPLTDDEPVFGAARIRMKLGAAINCYYHINPWIQVQKVENASNAQKSGLKPGDIIRAVSVPDRNETREGTLERRSQRLFRQIFTVPAPYGKHAPPLAQGGNMAILDGLYAGDLQGALLEHKDIRGEDSDVVFVIERPSVLPEYLEDAEKEAAEEAEAAAAKAAAKEEADAARAERMAQREQRRRQKEAHHE